MSDLLLEGQSAQFIVRNTWRVHSNIAIYILRENHEKIGLIYSFTRLIQIFSSCGQHKWTLVTREKPIKTGICRTSVLYWSSRPYLICDLTKTELVISHRQNPYALLASISPFRRNRPQIAAVSDSAHSVSFQVKNLDINDLSQYTNNKRTHVCYPDEAA